MNEARNRLGGQQSPFLQHGAAQPVDWFPWGAEAFERARAENRPILLDIGAVWCHWCHVMDRESYEDADTAALINELFVPVKVDRDERPDVDARYQRAVQALNGEGGWPLTAFLTPDGEVFYGGTYFPAEDRYGRPSFQRVLREVARIWTDEHARAQEAARTLRARLDSYARSEVQAGDVTDRMIDETAEEFAQAFDFRWGGFGRAPKFPNPGALRLLLDYALDTGTEWAHRIVVETLRAMARGGIYDQLGGGFHRYSTDARWLVPHFEKMAYDNGPLLELYACAAAAYDDDSFAGAARGIVEHFVDVAPDLVAHGGFPASQDADIGSDDGDYWTWTRAELQEALAGDEEAFAAAIIRFGLDDPGSAMHSDPDRHVLFCAHETLEVARRTGFAADVARGAIQRAAERLKQVRDARPRPYVDETQYSGWVALVASGHLATARYQADEAASARGVRALERIWRDAHVPQRGVLHRVGDTASGFLLEDQAYVAQALLDAYEVTQAGEWLERAITLMQELERFEDPAGGYRDRAQDDPAETTSLAASQRTITDSPTPAANAVVAIVFSRLYALTHDDAYRAAAERVLRTFAGSAARMRTATATFARAVAWHTQPVTTLLIAATPDDAEGAAMLDAALRQYAPRSVVRRLDPAGADPAALPPELAAMVTRETPRAYICVGSSCAPPMRSAAELREFLQQRSR